MNRPAAGVTVVQRFGEGVAGMHKAEKFITGTFIKTVVIKDEKSHTQNPGAQAIGITSWYKNSILHTWSDLHCKLPKS